MCEPYFNPNFEDLNGWHASRGYDEAESEGVLHWRGWLRLRSETGQYEKIDIS